MYAFASFLCISPCLSSVMPDETNTEHLEALLEEKFRIVLEEKLKAIFEDTLNSILDNKFKEIHFSERSIFPLANQKPDRIVS